MAVSVIAANLYLIYKNEGDEGRPYRVEAERIAYDMEREKPIELSDYEHITAVVKLEADATFNDVDSDYLIKRVGNELFRFDYNYQKEVNNKNVRIILNICLGIVFAAVLFLMFYIGRKIVMPFERISSLPEELAKGNITTPLNAEKEGFFGKFLWGLDLLREKLEKGRQQDIEARKNNKRLILSLSHDIKTPLGIIELNSKALERGLYDKDEEKKKKIAVSINEKCIEIKNYVDEIIRASKEDFTELEVKNGEFYLSKTIEEIRRVYIDKLALLQIDFKIGDYSDCILKGDPDRTVEVLQNLLENAVKYGDGKSIEIAFEQEENSLLISVINTGCTLKDDELNYIFDSFWRGSNIKDKSGSGLGLYISRQLMGKMNGDIFAETEGEKIRITIVLGMA